MLLAGCLLDPERWKESTTRSKGALEPLHQQQSALPAMAQDMLNTSLQELGAALLAFHEQRQACPHHDLVVGEGCTGFWGAAAAVWAAHTLRSVFEREMRQLGDGGKLLSLLQDVEVPVQRVLSDMEFTGLGMDRNLLLQQKEEIQVCTCQAVMMANGVEQLMHRTRVCVLRSVKQQQSCHYEGLLFPASQKISAPTAATAAHCICTSGAGCAGP